jgi:hypothetical protein
MKAVELIQIDHSVKIGDSCGPINPNITEDCIFYEGGVAIGFFIRNIGAYSKSAEKLIEIANSELMSDRVPKQNMDRKKPVGTDKNGKNVYHVISQYSTIVGSVPPKPHMRRAYGTRSSVHACASAKTFVKAMYLLAIESEKLIKQIIPEQYERQVELFKSVPKKWKFGNLFTSSISNFNISAPFHRDAANIVGAVNVIITKRENSVGGNLHVPDYGATMDSCDNSILVYPAWKNVHGVTPIIPTAEGGYRNSLVFYPLRAFRENQE